MSTGSFGPKQRVERQPLNLELYGEDSEGNPVGPATFSLKRSVQGAVLMEAAKRGQNPQNADELCIFIRECMANEAEQIRFYELIHSDNFIIDIETLGEVYKWLNEQYADRPTSTSAGLQNGPTPTGTISTDVSTSTAPPTPEPWTQPTHIPSSTSA